MSTINTLRNNSAPGLDGFSSIVIKTICKNITRPLVHIFNLIIQSGTFPDLVKQTCVRPLYKGGDETLLTNYSPTSLISNLAKILEKLIKKELIYLEKEKILSPNQFGFREGKSTEDALVELIN